MFISSLFFFLIASFHNTCIKILLNLFYDRRSFVVALRNFSTLDSMELVWWFLLYVLQKISHSRQHKFSYNSFYAGIKFYLYDFVRGRTQIDFHEKKEEKKYYESVTLELLSECVCVCVCEGSTTSNDWNYIS